MNRKYTNDIYNQNPDKQGDWAVESGQREECLVCEDSNEPVMHLIY